MSITMTMTMTRGRGRGWSKSRSRSRSQNLSVAGAGNLKNGRHQQPCFFLNYCADTVPAQSTTMRKYSFDTLFYLLHSKFLI